MPAVLNLALAAFLWFWLFGELGFEWSVSEQYGYGLFVPFLGAYLLWLRVADMPAPRPWTGPFPVFTVLALVALAYYPLAVLFSANADWRLLPWSLALLALASTILLLARWGGPPWVRHFLPALVLFLFAVPWPSTIEVPLVDQLMTFVATVSTEGLHLLGFEAIRQGHTIQLPTGFVEVEEACSGVRSIQSTIMAGWLVGELWRFRPISRGLLLVWAAAVAVAFNLLRTFLLAWLSALRGPDVMAQWHDTAGYLVFALSFATVLGGAWLARPRALRIENLDTNAPASNLIEKSAAGRLNVPSPRWLPPRGVIVVLLLLLGPLPVVFAWYALRAPAIIQPTWHLNLPAAVSDAKVEPLAPSLTQALYSDAGLQASWTDDAGHEWLLYYLVWQRARAAQLGGVHVPLRCLPAVGWVLDHQGPNLAWNHGGVSLIFNTYVFVHGPTHIYVFYGQWDPAGYPYYDKIGRFPSDRLLDAWDGQRMAGKHLLEIGLVNAPSLPDATRAVENFLDRAIIIDPVAATPTHS
jgi:exosortase